MVVWLWCGLFWLFGVGCLGVVLFLVVVGVFGGVGGWWLWLLFGVVLWLGVGCGGWCGAGVGCSWCVWGWGCLGVLWGFVLVVCCCGWGCLVWVGLWWGVVVGVWVFGGGVVGVVAFGAWVVVGWDGVDEIRQVVMQHFNGSVSRLPAVA
ncbi:hypothetical protein RA262_27575, partial [Pseudomonas syringae pv. tagetis]